jgi:hypothetical protein
MRSLAANRISTGRGLVCLSLASVVLAALAARPAKAQPLLPEPARSQGGRAGATLPSAPGRPRHHDGAGDADTTDRGIVQAVRHGRLVLRELDGSTVTIRVDRSTQIFLDGRRVRLRAIRRGDVADVTTHAGSGTADVIRAFRTHS